MQAGELKEIEKVFKEIRATEDNMPIQIYVTKNLKKEIDALEKLSVILQTIGIGDIIKLYTKKKMGGR